MNENDCKEGLTAQQIRYVDEKIAFCRMLKIAVPYGLIRHLAQTEDLDTYESICLQLANKQIKQPRN